MSESETVLCPDCGWTGVQSALVEHGDDYQCPVCAEVIEFVE